MFLMIEAMLFIALAARAASSAVQDRNANTDYIRRMEAAQ